MTMQEWVRETEPTKRARLCARLSAAAAGFALAAHHYAPNAAMFHEIPTYWCACGASVALLVVAAFDRVERRAPWRDYASV